MIELKNVNKYYSSSGITNLGLHNINLKLSLGEIVAITGDSGSGKSTLLNVISKIDSFDEGEIYYKGNDTSYFSLDDMDDFRKNKVGFIFQDYKIIDSYTVLENVMLPLVLRGIKTKEAKEEAISLLKKVGLENKIHSRGSKLSGGEKQRCVIARALASKCEILVCDEPTGNLDSKTSKEIIKLIKENANNRLVLIVTHNFDEVKDIVTRKIRLVDGTIVEDTKYQNIDDNLNEELDLDYKKLSKKIGLKVAKRNILSTPRKTLFLCSVIFTISIITIFLFQLIATLRTSFAGMNQYKNIQENRLYVYKDNHEELDLEKIKKITDNYVINPFYEDKTFGIINAQTRLAEIYEVLYCEYPAEYKLVKGEEPIATNEVFIVMPKNDYHIADIDNLVGKEIYVNNSIEKYKLVGYGISDKVKNATFTKCPKLAKSLADVSPNISMKDAEIRNTLSNRIRVIVPEKNYPVNVTLFNIYNISNENYDVIVDESISSVILEVPHRVVIENQIFEVSVYTSTPKKTADKLRHAGFSVDIVSTVNDQTSLEKIGANVLIYSLIILASTSLVSVFFITYFILAKVYASKTKDYQILRTLGVTKRDMRMVVSFEVGIIGVLSMIIAYITFALCIYLIPKLALLRPLEFGISLIYFIVISIFIYATIRRFNRKLFKFSIVSSLKGDK